MGEDSSLADDEAVTSEDKNVSMRGQEFSRNSRTGDDRNAFTRRGIADRERKRERERERERKKEKKKQRLSRDPRSALPEEKKKKLNRCSRSRAKYGSCYVSRDDRDTLPRVQRARTSFACSIFLLDARPRQPHNGPRFAPTSPQRARWRSLPWNVSRISLISK